MKRKNLFILILVAALALLFSGCYDWGYVLSQKIEGELVPDSAGWAELDFFSRNGTITVKPVDGSEFRVELEMRVRTSTRAEAEKAVEEAVVIENLTGFLRVGVDDSRISARMVAEVPRDLFYDLRARTSNGGITLEEIELGEVSLNSSNGALTLTNIKFDLLKGVTSNGGLRVAGVYGDKLELETSNGRVDLEGAARVFNIRTSNSRIELSPSFISDRAELTARTSNGSVNLKLPVERNTGFEIEGITSNGTFTYSALSNMVSIGSNRIQSRDFSAMTRQVKIYLGTSNGNIEVKER